MTVVSFEDYHGPLARATERAETQLDKFLRDCGSILDIARYVSFEKLRADLIAALYDIETCMPGDKRLSNPRF